MRCDLPETIHVRLTVYDMLGREIARLADGILPAGEHQSIRVARSNPSGMYIIRLEAGA
ncbi:MAG: T9SS C-terminal target domain-containing protein [Balneolaceae bacterium]|nr:MAG: T9SS C-terminal target domain-containing protein [Balneolaceae bacterium]